MDVPVDELRQSFKELADAELVRIARGSAEEYRREAIDMAGAELVSRGIDLQRYPALSPGDAPPGAGPAAGEAAGQDRRRPLVRFPRWWSIGCLIAGLGIFLALLRNPEIQSGQSITYSLAAAIDLMVLADLDRFFDWSNQGRSFKIRSGGQALVAIGMTVWAFLRLFEVVKY